MMCEAVVNCSSGVCPAENTWESAIWSCTRSQVLLFSGANNFMRSSDLNKSYKLTMVYLYKTHCREPVLPRNQSGLGPYT
uniref:Uncharacterized protein n=1 Tax=Populus trichocarpa TaxID=3694 RepID=A0A2K1YBN4_POPTR